MCGNPPSSSTRPGRSFDFVLPGRHRPCTRRRRTADCSRSTHSQNRKKISIKNKRSPARSRCCAGDILVTSKYRRNGAAGNGRSNIDWTWTRYEVVFLVNIDENNTPASRLLVSYARVARWRFKQCPNGRGRERRQTVVTVSILQIRFYNYKYKTISNSAFETPLRAEHVWTKRVEWTRCRSINNNPSVTILLNDRHEISPRLYLQSLLLNPSLMFWGSLNPLKRDEITSDRLNFLFHEILSDLVPWHQNQFGG